MMGASKKLDRIPVYWKPKTGSREFPRLLEFGENVELFLMKKANPPAPFVEGGDLMDPSF